MSAASIGLGLFVLTVVFVVWRLYERHTLRRLSEENAVRERLGLPPLARDEFEMNIVEKSAEYRGRINQHM